MKQTVKKLLLIAVVMMATLSANAQMAELEKYANEKKVEYYYVSKTMLTLAKNFSPISKAMGSNATKFMGKVNGIQLIHTANEDGRQMLTNDVGEVLIHNSFETIVQFEDGNKSMKAYGNFKKKEAVVVVVGNDKDDMLTIVLTGKFSKKDVEKLLKK